MEESRRSRTYKKIPFTRELHKLQSHLSERSPEDTKVSFDKLKHLYRELMVACEHYEDSLLEIDDPDKFNELCSESDTYISEIHNKYCSVIDQANTFLESFSLLKESEPRSIKHDESTKPKAMIAEQSASDSTHVLSQSVNKSASLDSNLTELIKLLQLPKVELQIFDGSPSKYYKFINQFKQSVENFTDDPLTRLNLLQQYCTGKAAKLISACSKSSSAEGYSEALDILEQRCGNPHVISEEIISSLRMGKAVRTARDLMELSDSLQEAYSTLLQLHKLNEVSSQSFFKDILNRIYIRSVKGKWRNLAADVLDKTNEYPYFPDFVDFIFKEAKHLNDPVYGLDVFKSDPVGTSYKKSYCSATSVSCPSCKEEHVLLKCPTFKRLSVDSRRAFVEAHNLCNLCLGGHGDTCKSNYKCSKCKQRHSYLLHQESTRDLPVSVNLLNHNSSILPLVPVIVNGSYKTHALVDSGATDSFCTQRLLNYFAGKLDVIKARFPLDTVTGVCTKNKNVVKRLSLSSPSNGDTLQMFNLAVIDHIPVNNAKIDVSLYPHLQDIPGLCLGGNVNVDVIIGQDHSEALLPLDVVSDKKGKPFACKYLLGWAVSGSVNLPSVTPHKAICNFISSSHVPYRTSTSSKSPQNLDLLWNEELQDLNDSCLSVDDKFVLNLGAKEAFLNEFSHYVIPLPIRSNPVILDNVYIAEHRLNNLFKSLSRKNAYQRYMYDLEINKWKTTTRDLRIGDLVLLLDESLPRSLWPMALVKEVKVGRDGRVRSSRVKTRSSEFIRPINKLVLLEGVD
ncbi:hypothetical protein SNE40_001491 [Patella caerulea]|uniref:DUF5641 domain-containing protein n=1 Tax=Patella caerulea TaxID=87958 RepID=A0AAN8Q317_PATCE